MSDDDLARDKPTAMKRAVFCGLLTLRLIAGAIVISETCVLPGAHLPVGWPSPVPQGGKFLSSR